MKQDQSYFKQVFYLREDNFGLKIKKNVALKITCKIVAFVYRKLSFKLFQKCNSHNNEIIPAVVAWFVKASVFHSVNSAPSANGGSSLGCVVYL